MMGFSAAGAASFNKLVGVIDRFVENHFFRMLKTAFLKGAVV